MSFNCRSCGGSNLHRVIDLGKTPLANALLTENQLNEPEPRFPLNVVFCEDCTLLQITETVPPDMLFSDYVYFSSFSDTAVASAKDLASALHSARDLTPESLVVEIASNDGYLLRHYRDAGIPVLGVEPAANIAQAAREAGIDTRCAFFGPEEAARMIRENLHADVIHANNVLAHVADLNGFVKGLKTLLKPAGLVVIEVPYVGDMIEQVEFDTIYHEHLCYFSLTALDQLFVRHNLEIFDVERISIHGGSLRIYVGHGGEQRTDRAANLAAHEENKGLTEHAYYADFAGRVTALKEKLISTLARLKADDMRIVGYGASAKGATLLNTFGIGAKLLDFIADRSSVKQGKFAPGTHLPIVNPDVLLEQQPDYALLLTWNFADEILEQQKEYRSRGGKFIIPVPDVQIV